MVGTRGVYAERILVLSDASEFEQTRGTGGGRTA